MTLTYKILSPISIRCWMGKPFPIQIPSENSCQYQNRYPSLQGNLSLTDTNIWKFFWISSSLWSELNFSGDYLKVNNVVGNWWKEIWCQRKIGSPKQTITYAGEIRFQLQKTWQLILKLLISSFLCLFLKWFLL